MMMKNQNKENKSVIENQGCHSSNPEKVEILSLKQEVKQLRGKINELEKQKEHLKKLHEEKEVLYSKMIFHPH